MNDVVEDRGSGWLVYSSILLVIAGVSNLFNGLWALHHTSSRGLETFVFDDSLNSWGWVHTILGIVIVAAGLALLGRAQWARWVGVVAASAAIVVNIMWITIAPIASLVVILLAMLVVFGLVVYGERDGSAIE